MHNIIIQLRALALFIPISILLLAAMPACVPGNVARLSTEEFDSLSNVFYEDGATVAVRAMREKMPEQIWLDKGFTNYYLDRIIDIYVFAGQHGKEDSLHMIRKIHTSHSPSIYRVAVNTDSTAYWMDNWSRNLPDAGNSDANELIKKYRLKLSNYTAAQTGAFGIITVPEPANTYALARLLKGLPGVRSAEPDMSMGGGQEINVYNEDNTTIWEYMQGSGDCMSGCIHKKYWRFSVGEDRTIKYLGTEGSLPAGVQ